VRVLVTSPATLGHLQPLVPLARALRDTGNEVLWAVPADGVAEIERRGLSAAGVAPALPIGPVLVMERFPELRELPPEQVPAVMFGKLFGAIAAPVMLGGLRALGGSWRPDVIVCDAAEFAGHIVAAELGVPSVTKGFGPLLPESRVAAAGDEVAGLWEACGLVPRPYGGCYETLYLDPYPPSLGSSDAAHVPVRRPIRPDGDYDAVAAADVTIPAGDDPLLYVTLGTMFNDPGPLRTVVDAVTSLSVRALITVGPGGDPEALGPTPPGVRVERYVAQHVVLPRCAGVVSHGGSGTALGALALGLPQLCLPRGADQFLNAAAIASSGAGLSVGPSEVTADAVRRCLERLLDDASFAIAAQRIADEIAAMPSPTEAALAIADLI
jgi:UDP:flavonoid glycosyltransferase YjiC (YdhE family)